MWWNIRSWLRSALSVLLIWLVANGLLPRPTAVSAAAFIRRSLLPSSRRWRRAPGWHQSSCGPNDVDSAEAALFTGSSGSDHTTDQTRPAQGADRVHP